MNEIPWLFYGLLAFVVGLNLGSFFNVVIYRFPAGLSVVSPPSACPKCSYQLKWFDNVPVLAWLWLRGKCRNCRTPISCQYPIVEFGTGVLGFLGIWLSYITVGQVNVVHMAGALLLLYIVIPIFVIDIRHFLIPDMLVFPCSGIAFALSFVDGGLSWALSLIGGLGVSGALWSFTFLASKILKKDAMGFGDIKIVAFFGLLMGWQSTILIIVMASFLGVLIMLPVQKMAKSAEGGILPFGPFLLGAAIIVYFYGSNIIEWYFKFLGMGI